MVIQSCNAEEITWRVNAGRDETPLPRLTDLLRLRGGRANRGRERKGGEPRHVLKANKERVSRRE